MSALDVQVDGDHYKKMAIQPVEFIHKNGIGFIEGAVIKYVCRHKFKGGRKDIEKAIHFLQILLEEEYSANPATVQLQALTKQNASLGLFQWPCDKPQSAYPDNPIHSYQKGTE